MTNSQGDMRRQIELLKDVVPSPESTRRALAKVRGVLLDQPLEDRLVQARRNVPRAPWRFALGVCAAVAIAAIACFAWLPRGSLAFAEVQQQIRQMRTVTYNFVTGGDGHKITVKHTISGTRERVEWPGHTRIRVPDRKTALLINHDERTALFSHDNSGKERKATDLYGRLVSIAESSVKELGKRTIDGEAAIGFEVSEIGNGEPMVVWVNPRTRLPIKIVAAGNRILQDFKFNVDVAEDLFEFKVPAGYFVENRYEAFQAPVTLEADELQKYASLVTNPNRSPQQTVEAYLKLAAAGKTGLARKLQRDASPDDIRELDGFRELTVEKTYVTGSAALAVTSASISYRGDRRALVFTVKRFDRSWLIDDIDLETADGVQDEIQRFLADHPTAKEVESGSPGK